MKQSTPDRLRVHDGRAFGFYQVNNEVIDDHGHALGPYALAVYHALCRYAGNGNACEPSHARLAHVCGMSRRSVFTALRVLEDAGLVASRTRRDGRGQTTNEYTLLSLTPCRRCTGSTGASARDAGRACTTCDHPDAPRANEEDVRREDKREEEDVAPTLDYGPLRRRLALAQAGDVDPAGPLTPADLAALAASPVGRALLREHGLHPPRRG